MRWLSPSLVTLLIGVPLCGLASGALLSYLTLLQEQQGFSRGFIGLGHALHIGSVCVVAPLTPWLLQKIAAPKLLLINNGLLLATLWLLSGLAEQATEPNALLLFARFMLGLFLGGHYLIGESWLNHLAPPEKRGRVLGLYGMLLGLMLGGGPMIVAAFGEIPGFIWQFSGAIYLTATLLMASQWKTAFRPPLLPLGLLLKQLFHWPTIMACLLTYGALEGMLVTMLPLHALAAGYPKVEALWLVTAGCGGAIAMQWAFGWLADHYPRKYVLLGACSGATVAAFLLWLTLPYGPMLQVSAFLWGGVFSALYTVPYVMLAERMSGLNIAVASASALMMYGLGSLIGPPLAGLAMDRWPQEGFPAVALAASLLCLGMVALRLRAAPQPLTKEMTP